MAAEGLITFDELREKLIVLEENRETARRELEALEKRHERIVELERDRDALLDSLVAVIPDALEALASEERLNLYQMLGLRVVLRQDGASRRAGRSWTLLACARRQRHERDPPPLPRPEPAVLKLSVGELHERLPVPRMIRVVYVHPPLLDPIRHDGVRPREAVKEPPVGRRPETEDLWIRTRTHHTEPSEDAL